MDPEAKYRNVLVTSTGQLVEGDYQTVEATLGDAVIIECALSRRRGAEPNAKKSEEEPPEQEKQKDEEDEEEEEEEVEEVNWRRWPRRADATAASVRSVEGALVFERVSLDDQALYRCSVASSSSSSSNLTSGAPTSATPLDTDGRRSRRKQRLPQRQRHGPFVYLHVRGALRSSFVSIDSSLVTVDQFLC